MKLSDALQISFKNIWGYKKRTFLLIIIVGALFSLLMAACIILKGTEDVAFKQATDVTDGKVLLLAAVDTENCGEDCDLAAEIAQAEKIVDKYGGTVEGGRIYRDIAGTFYAAPSILRLESQQMDGDIPVVAVSTNTARKWQKIDLRSDMTTQEKVKVVERTVKGTEGKAVKYSNIIGASDDEAFNTEYRIAGLLPSGVGVTDLNLGTVGGMGNVLNLALVNIQTGDSLNFVLQPSQAMKISAYEMQEVGKIWAIFPDVKSAYEFSRDKANVCEDYQKVMHNCHKDYKFEVQSAIYDPLTNQETFLRAWSVLRMFMVFFVVVVIIISLTTFVRLIYSDTKTVSLYYALGASKFDVVKLYLIYFLVISLLAVFFALVIAMGVVLILNLVNQTMLRQVFTLGFGKMMGRTWLMGFCQEIFWIGLVIIIMAPVGILLAYPAFSNKSLSKKMKSM